VTYTDEEMKAATDAAVVKATSALQAKVAELEKAAETSQTEAQIAAARTELQAQLDEATAKLDAAVLEAQGEKAKREEIETWLSEEAAKAEQAKLITARRDDRLTRVKEVASFPDDYLEKNVDRFAAMSDEDFAARLEEWREIAAKAGTPVGGGGIPSQTSLTASRDGSGRSSSTGMAEVREVMGLRNQGIDPRVL
jgi:hypothetical protein